MTVEITTPAPRKVIVKRAFHAPRRLVFDALTQPELVRRWYARVGWTLVVCDIDLAVGGKWRFVLHRPNGKTVGQFGVYREIVPGERLVNTEAWEDWDAGETIVTTELQERDGGTLFTATMVFPSEAVRDTVLKSGLEHSVKELYTKLDELLASL